MRKNFVVVAILVIAIFLAACTTSTKKRNLISDAEPNVKLMKNNIVYITSVKDGVFGYKTYIGSGLNVTNMLVINLRPHIQKYIMGQEENSDLSNDFTKAKEKDAYYVIKPTILHWEPRAAAWSGMATRVSIHISVYTVSDEKEIISRILEVNGRNVTFTSQSAEELAGFIIKQFCEDIF